MIIVVVSEKGKREFMMFACVSVCVWKGRERVRGGEGVLCLRCDVCVVCVMCEM